MKLKRKIQRSIPWIAAAVGIGMAVHSRLLLNETIDEKHALEDTIDGMERINKKGPNRFAIHLPDEKMREIRAGATLLYRTDEKGEQFHTTFEKLPQFDTLPQSNED